MEGRRKAREIHREIPQDYGWAHCLRQRSVQAPIETTPINERRHRFTETREKAVLALKVDND